MVPGFSSRSRRAREWTSNGRSPGIPRACPAWSYRFAFRRSWLRAAMGSTQRFLAPPLGSQADSQFDNQRSAGDDAVVIAVRGDQETPISLHIQIVLRQALDRN